MARFNADESDEWILGDTVSPDITIIDRYEHSLEVPSGCETVQDRKVWNMAGAVEALPEQGIWYSDNLSSSAMGASNPTFNLVENYVEQIFEGPAGGTYTEKLPPEFPSPVFKVRNVCSCRILVVLWADCVSDESVLPPVCGSWCLFLA